MRGQLCFFSVGIRVNACFVSSVFFHSLDTSEQGSMSPAGVVRATAEAMAAVGGVLESTQSELLNQQPGL